MYESFNHLRKVRLLTPAAFAKADLVIAFMSFVYHFSFKDSIITGSSSDTLLTMPYVDHLIAGRVLHFPSVSFLRCPVAVVVVVEREDLGALLAMVLNSKQRVIVNEFSFCQFFRDSIENGILLVFRQRNP